MRRFLITSPKFTGQAEVVYNDAGVLCKIDCTDAGMDAYTVYRFKNAVGASIPEMSTRFSDDTIFVEAEYEATFEMFYNNYPHKRNRYKVEAAWDKLPKTKQVQAYFSLEEYKKYLKRSGCFPMIGDRYLRDREFETEWKAVR